MIQHITTWTNTRSGKTQYRVTYDRKARKYTTETLPKTAKSFMQTHSFEKTACGMLFR